MIIKHITLVLTIYVFSEYSMAFKKDKHTYVAFKVNTLTKNESKIHQSLSAILLRTKKIFRIARKLACYKYAYAIPVLNKTDENLLLTEINRKVIKMKKEKRPRLVNLNRFLNTLFEASNLIQYNLYSRWKLVDKEISVDADEANVMMLKLKKKRDKLTEKQVKDLKKIEKLQYSKRCPEWVVERLDDEEEDMEGAKLYDPREVGFPKRARALAFKLYDKENHIVRKASMSIVFLSLCRNIEPNYENEKEVDLAKRTEEIASSYLVNASYPSLHTLEQLESIESRFKYDENYN